MLTRKERDDLRKRREILETALEIFAARGFHSTTMGKMEALQGNILSIMEMPDAAFAG